MCCLFAFGLKAEILICIIKRKHTQNQYAFKSFVSLLSDDETVVCVHWYATEKYQISLKVGVS